MIRYNKKRDRFKGLVQKNNFIRTYARYFASCSLAAMNIFLTM